MTEKLDPITEFVGPYHFMSLFYPTKLTTSLKVNDKHVELSFPTAGHLLHACKVYHFRRGTPSSLKMEYIQAIQKAKRGYDVLELSAAAPINTKSWNKNYLGWLRSVQEFKFLGAGYEYLPMQLANTVGRRIAGNTLQSLVLEDLREKVLGILQDMHNENQLTSEK